MSPVAENLKSALLELSPEDRTDLVAFLLRTLDSPGDFDFDGYWIGELARRGAEIESGQVTGIPANEAFARLREKYS